MAKWNKQHPEDTFSWVAIADDTPAAQKSCRHCKKEFASGRVTRLTAKVRLLPSGGVPHTAAAS